jgi:hypothetical protein
MDDGLFLQNWIVIEKLIWCKARLSLLLLFWMCQLVLPFFHNVKVVAWSWTLQTPELWAQINFSS